MSSTTTKYNDPPGLIAQILTVSRIDHEYDQTYSYWLKPTDEVNFVAGQYFHLVAPEESISKATARHMSVASSPLDDELLFSMSVASQSQFKKRFSEVSVGDEVRIFHVDGEFTLDEIPEGAELVFVAGGIGITPFRSLIRDIELRKLNYSWSLIHVGRNYLYKKDFETYQSPQIHITRKDVPEVVERTVREHPEAYYFVSGSERFIEGMADRFVEQGIDRAKIRQENFNH
ncbi:FAD-dependent oxidoreductase [Pontiellaceae bacterium B12219]|nr:FAD-dependent oxidoreductase [Pontiellaceae bacterium B12219]